MSSDGHHPALAHHFDDLQQQHESATMGMWAFLAQEIMFFGGLFGGYAVYRYKYFNAFVEGSNLLPIGWGALNTAILIGSSFTVAMAVRSAQLGHHKALFNWFMGTMVLGLAFLGVKSIEYSHKYHDQLIPGLNFVWDGPDLGRFGVSICYDLWFPETARTLAAQGAEVILHPTLTGTIDRDVELAIVRATAAQNQCFVFGINGFGDGGNGRSIIVGPAGEVLYQGQSAPEMIPFEIDLERVRRSREVGLRGLGQQLKSFRDRAVEFPVYETDGRNWPYLQSLGPLVKPDRRSSAGLQPKDTGE